MDGEKKWLWGAQAIADRIGVERRKAYYLLQTGRIPAKKVGSDWVAEAGAVEGALMSEITEG